jgi:pyrimidine-nucleoside phosphorylase
MEQPLGNMIGNSLEIIESIECLKGNGPADLMEVTMALSEEMLLMGGRVKSKRQARRLLNDVINSGRALEKFQQIITMQNGDVKVVEDYRLLPQAKYRIDVKSPKSGYIEKIDTLTMGLLSVELGCGRRTIDDKIDYSAGFILNKKIGDKVKKGDVLVEIFGQAEKVKSVSKKINDAYKIGKEKVRPPRLIIQRIQ